jgi:hypothetical protein
MLLVCTAVENCLIVNCAWIFDEHDLLAGSITDADRIVGVCLFGIWGLANVSVAYKLCVVEHSHKVLRVGGQKVDAGVQRTTGQPQGPGVFAVMQDDQSFAESYSAAQTACRRSSEDGTFGNARCCD